MDHEDDKFLRLTFDGGRFEGHSIPVAVLAELSTFQKLLFTVARQLFLDEDPKRERVPRGFADGAQLFLKTTEHNCFTAGLERPRGLGEHEWYFSMARDMAISALAATETDATPLPKGFPREAHKLLADVGRRLGDGESLVVRNGQGPSARVTKSTRKRLATLINVPLEVEEAIDGEVEKVDDERNILTLRLKDDRLEVPYARTLRSRVADAFHGRPLVGIHFQGLVTWGARKARPVEELEIFEHPRAEEVKRLWGRLDHLSKIEDGWIEGDGVAPTATAVTKARDILARLLVDYEWVDRPKVFPVPDGGVQAEWTIGSWMCEVIFSPGGEVKAEATNVDDDRDSEIDLSGVNAGNADQLEKWLSQLRSTLVGSADRVQ